MGNSNKKRIIKEKAKKIRVSFGIWTVFLPFLTPDEQLFLQLGDKFLYEIAIGRVITRFNLKKPLFFLANQESILRTKLSKYDFS